MNAPFSPSANDIDLMLKKIRQRETGYSLDRLFYTSAAVYERDLRNLWCESWLWAGHTSQLSKVGDYFLFSFGVESIIVVRDEKEGIVAHLNVCRHRGSRICLHESGNTRTFVCPYHGWTYQLDGELRAGRSMGDSFNVSDHGLQSAHVLVYHGLIFICLADPPPNFDRALEVLAPHIAPFDIASAKIAHRIVYPVPANWKLALENYLECYHCAPSHRAYSRSHSLKDPDSMTPELMENMSKGAAQAGVSVQEISANGLNADPIGTDIYHRRYPLYPGYVTGSESGKPVAPLLGELRSCDGGATDIQIGPFNFFLAYSDYVVGYRFIPRELQLTDIETVWMVRADAEEGRDYQLDELTWLWDVTTQDDERIIRNNQQGVNSSRYIPGPLAPMEWGISDFHGLYLELIKKDLKNG